MVFVFLYCLGLCTIHKNSYLGETIATSHNVECNDPNNNLGIQGFSHLDVFTKYQVLNSIIVLIPMGIFLDTINHVNY